MFWDPLHIAAKVNQLVGVLVVMFTDSMVGDLNRCNGRRKKNPYIVVLGCLGGQIPRGVK